jgi:hypothetical protein
MGMPVGAPTTMPMGGIAGVTAPQYGMPMCGTPIGLPGPPSVPFGVPAGLQKHVVKNHTRVHMPKPTECVKVDVKQVPGMSYPKPVNHVRIVERTSAGLGAYRQPVGNRRECVRPDGSECVDQNCEEADPGAEGDACPTQGTCRTKAVSIK